MPITIPIIPLIFNFSLNKNTPTNAEIIVAPPLINANKITGEIKFAEIVAN